MLVRLSCLLSSASAQGFIEWRVFSLFEGLIEGLGVQVRAGGFGSSFDAESCPLQYELLHRRIDSAFDAILAAEEKLIRKGVRTIGAALRSVASSATRCNLHDVSSRLSAIADEASTLTTNAVEVQPLAADVSSSTSARTKRHGILTVTLGEVNVSEPLVRAARLWFRERYTESGNSLATLVRLALVDDEKAEAETREAWSGISDTGQPPRTEKEYFEQLRAVWDRAAESERQAEETQAQGPLFSRPFQGLRPQSDQRIAAQKAEL